MKHRLFFILFFISASLYSQERFNVILEDTIAHIPGSVVESNGFYYVLSGTGSESGIRSFCVTKVNETGEIQRKNIIANDSLELWEGRDHSLKKTSNGFFTAGTANNIYGKKGFFLTDFNPDLNLVSQKIIMYDTIWQKCFNSLKTDEGNIFITGQYYDDTLENAYLYLMKFNSSDKLIWKRAYTDSYSSGSQLLECMNGDVICGGYQSNGYSDWLINRYTNQGDLLWSKEFGWLGSRNDGAVSALQETPDSCILACGSYPGIKTMADIYSDGCIRKIDKEGELVWERFYRNYSGDPDDEDWILSRMNVSACVELENGDFAVVGSSYSYYTIFRGYMMRLNANGEIKWHKYYYAEDPGSSGQYLNTLIKTYDGGFLLGGYGNDYEEQGYYPPQQRWLVKTDSLGMDGLCNSEPDALEVDIDLPEHMCAFDTLKAYAYIAGPTAPYTLSISNGQQIDSIYYPPVFVPVEIGPGTIEIKYDATTVMEFEEPVVTLANHEWGECIAIPIEYYVGNQMGAQNIDITVTDGWGNSKTITKPVYVETCHDGINDGSFNPLQVYPNPASDVLTIEFAGNTRSLPIRIYDLLGKEVMTSRFDNSRSVINISELPAGTYRIVIGSFGKSFSVVR